MNSPKRGNRSRPRSAASRARRKDLPIGLIGTTQSGKTVYVTVLDWMIGAGRSSRGWKKEYGDVGTSIFLEERLDELRAGLWPAATPPESRQHLHMRLHEPSILGGKLIHINILELAGELTEILTRTDHWESVDEARDLVKWLHNCQGLLIMLDREKAPREDRAYQRLFLGMENLMRLGDRDKIPIPVAFVLTKDDKYKTGNPLDAFKVLVPELFHVCTVRLRKWKVFSCSAVGCTVNGKPPSKLEPRGILEPLEFVLKYRRRTGSIGEEFTAPVYKEEPVRPSLVKFALCEDCGAKMEVKNPVRPVQVMCPSCGRIQTVQ